MDNIPIFIAGPCVIESKELLDCVAQELTRLNKKYNIQIISSPLLTKPTARPCIPSVDLGWKKDCRCYKTSRKNMD